MSNNPWLLPEGIEDILPDETEALEFQRRRLLNVFSSWGYRLVSTPMVEFLESLLTGTAHALDLETFKVTDQMSGRMMGIRADITPQIARIDARSQSDLLQRLCYCGSVLHTRTDEYANSRNPIQLGAELYGHLGIASDVEILCLMAETLETAYIPAFDVDLGHVGIYRGLAETAALSADDESVLFEMMQRKAQAEINNFVDNLGLQDQQAAMLKVLPELSGDVSVLSKAKSVLAAAPQTVLAAIDYIEKVAQQAKMRKPDLSLHFDLSELRGYGYKTGVVFASFVAGHGKEVARGGRYDGIGDRFGRSRPATGFSTDLKTLCKLGSYQQASRNAQAILAPYSGEDTTLRQTIKTLRADGQIVIEALSDADFKTQHHHYQRCLVPDQTSWVIKNI